MSAPERSDNPILCPEGYEIHTYCDRKGCGASGEWVGYNRAECRRQAKSMGWRFNRDRTATCGRCVGLGA